ncbi:MAG TPA: lysylphosphatidylglycerol synthase transmembrane domain-containing protein [Polyangiaceae bacterium]|nr:lysylphosphatidylglycerol synthase transmembrane domain-containing protein [Polyangiaceae bacterium]
MAEGHTLAGSSRRGWLSAAAKIAVSIALVALILWKVPVRPALASVAALSPLTILLVVALSFLFVAIAAFRWQTALRWIGARQSFRALFADVLVSMAYNMLLPTNIGGDVVRALRCAKRLEQPHQAWSSTIFERLVGLVALVLLAVPGVIMAPGRVREIAIAVGVCAVIGLAFVVFAHTPFRIAGKLLASRAPSVAGAGERIARDLSGPLATLRARLVMMAWSVVYQVVGLGILAVVVLDWGQPEMVWAILGAIPLALVLTLLPVSIAGIGVRESLFVVLLGRFGMASDRALSLAVVWLGSALLTAFAGVVVLLIESARRPAAPTGADDARGEAR